MRGSNQKILLMAMVVVAAVATARGGELGGFVTWSNNYYQTWGHQPLVINKTSELHLTLDHNSGTGFESLSLYGSGSFNVKIKAPETKSTGIITSFYLFSRSSRHDELCFQILGSNGPPYLLNTNMYLFGEGGKEQRFRLWFDPTKDYHSYRFLWNPNQLVFYVDDIPIRVYSKNPAAYYPMGQTMFIMGSVKNVSIMDPKQMPYIAKFQATKIEGCKTMFMDMDKKCTNPSFWWNRKQLNSTERKLYIKARNMYLDYDYCSDRKRYRQMPQECRSYS
ncbi:putative xyloglucan endotransglucosylase/hydrolase protein 11 [Cardamine amara subsp. amara]|uniref:Xyloglucan endotransglucosylase/hydrolase n=1 Tax=Cardamine amara subsp. amara TaxID=228776 RepID=A0ABD1BJI4_CARAN